MPKTYTAKEVKQALADVPDDAEVWGVMYGAIIVEHHSWTEQKSITELLEEGQ